MPQMIRQDNIPRMLVASTTTATLATTSGGQSTLITVGGQQYQPASLLTLNAATVGANGLDAGSLGASQLWYVYAIAHQTSFAMALVASLSATPTMPTGYGTAYKLIGAFNTNASSQISFTVTPEDGVVYPVPASFILGRTDGLAVPAGVVGENFLDTSSTNFTTTNASIINRTLQPGVWSLRTTTTVNGGGGPGIVLSISTTNNTQNAANQNLSSINAANGFGFCTAETIVNISTATTYYVVGGAQGSNLTGSATTRLICVRIA
jgi:hypothetical protein